MAGNISWRINEKQWRNGVSKALKIAINNGQPMQWRLMSASYLALINGSRGSAS
jgi:hypothetical protein